MKTRPKGAGSIPLEREPADGVARLRLGSYEFKKKGVSRFDLRDPYHLAVALTWPQFLAALLALYLSVNVVFTILFWLVPGSVANARPDSFSNCDGTARFDQSGDLSRNRQRAQMTGDIVDEWRSGRLANR